ncbi:MAG: hypothetical protein Q9178_003516 [Gyalolechia marmorata]
MVSWVITLYAIIIGVWWPRLQDYFVDRSLAEGIQHGGNKLAAIALTGHMCDVTMGMALVPISRHSALASFFQLSVSTTLTLHMLSAYTLFALVLVHTFLYVSWVAFINGISAHARKVLPVLNPTYLPHETWPGSRTSLGVWRASLIFTGLFAVIIMLALSVTTLPKIRRKHFNLFYFTHLSTTKDATTPAGNDEIVIQFLFRKVAAVDSYQDKVARRTWLSTMYSRFRQEPAKSAQWTEKIASSLDRKHDQQNHDHLERKEQVSHTSVDLALRLEGPYFSPADPSRYHTVVCLVAGTGISGAIAIAGAFRALHTSQSPAESGYSNSDSSEPVWRRCIIVWSVRERDYIDLPPLALNANVELQICLTGPGKPRQDLKTTMSGITQSMPPNARTWAYISGPRGYIESAKRVCKALSDVEYYAASWEI